MPSDLVFRQTADEDTMLNFIAMRYLIGCNENRIAKFFADIFIDWTILYSFALNVVTSQKWYLFPISNAFSFSGDQNIFLSTM